MIATPPLVTTVQRTPVALSILCGLAGLGVAVGAGLSGFIERLAQTALISFYWADTPRLVAVVALIGAVLALMRHDAGPPLVAGSGVVFAVVVATTLVSDRLDIGDFLDAYTWRAVAFVGGGVLAAVATVLGLASLRGRGRPGWGVATLVIGGGVLVCHAAFVRLDDRQFAGNVHPTIGIAVVLTVMTLGSFIGRAGALVATAGAVCLFPLYAASAEFSPSDRRPFVILAALGLAAITAVTVAVAVSAARRPVVQYFAPVTPTWAGYPPVEPTQQFPVQGGDISPYGTPVAVERPVGDDEPTRQIPAIESNAFDTWNSSNEWNTSNTSRDSTDSNADATTVVDAFSAPTQTVVAVASAPMSSVAQWASDPFGRHQMRYWDGGRWSEHVSNGGVAGTDAV